MLKAIILDFNGVILDDEPLHFAAMRETVARLGMDLTRDEYWDKYLPLDDRECLDAICRDHSVSLTDQQRAHALALKSQLYSRRLREGFPLFPGTAEFIKAAAVRYPLAICSGARRYEIESTLESTALRRYFVFILAAEDFVRGKPHPESFLLALERLNRFSGKAPVQAGECLVVEDSVKGVHGAKAAGMVCVAVANSYPLEALQAADMVVASLNEVRWDSLNALFEDPV